MVGFISFGISYSALKNQISFEKVNTLTQTKNTADVILKEIEKGFITESINPKLLTLTSNPIEDDYGILNDTIKELVNVKNANKYIFSIYVYIPSQKLIVTTEDGYWKTEAFYDLTWLDLVKNGSEGSWFSTRKIKTLSGENPGVVTLITSIPFDERININDNLLIVNVYEKELLRLIQDHNSLTSELSCIIDAKGKVVSHEDKSILGQPLQYEANVTNKILSEKRGSLTFKSTQGKYLASYAKSDYNKWSYVSFIPENQIIKPIMNLIFIHIIIAVICIFLSLIAARIISLKIYRPISDTVSSVKRYRTEIGTNIVEGNPQNEMDFINTTIEQIVEKNKDLRSTVRNNEAVVREGFILDILLSSTIDEVQLENKLNQFNISFIHPKSYVLVILIDKYSSFAKNHSEKDRALYSFGLKNVVEEIMNRESYGIVVQTDKDKFAAVLNSSLDLDYVTDIADQIRENIKNIFKFSLTVGISSDFSTPNEIGLMYNEAVDFAESRIVLGGDRTICKNDITLSRNGIFLVPTSREEQIFNNIKQSNINEAIKNIEKVLNITRKEAGYHPQEIHQFFYSILCYSIKAVNENGWSISDIFGDNCNLYQDLVENDTINDITDWIKEILTRMSHFILEKKESKNYSLIESILNYMQTNYNKDISLNSMADFVSLSTPYLSKLFKSETGENFLEYLTKIRIEKSKELLLNPNHKITNIAEKVNFGNAQNYIRIFKKYEGMTPGQYREVNIIQNLNNQ